MIIEIHGGQFQNLGAYQMMLTAMDQLNARLPNVKFAIASEKSDRYLLREHKIGQIWPNRGWMSGRSYRARTRLQFLLGDLLIRGKSGSKVSVADVDALIDISGFAFTDLWGNRPIRNFMYLVESYRKRNKPVVMLPQAFGPFNLKDNRSNFRRILSAANLVYARDRRSYKFAKELASATSSLHLSLDITFDAGKILTDSEASNQTCLIVPNIRMKFQGKQTWADNYQHFLEFAIQALISRGFEVKFLIHDLSGEDYLFTTELRDLVGQSIEVVRENDPWSVKQLIGNSSFIIGSRYHALVAAFSCGVPSIAMGWAHKYDALYEEFGLGEFVIGPNERKKLEKAINQLTGHEMNRELRQSIREKLHTIASETDQMWGDVIAVLLQRQAEEKP